MKRTYITEIGALLALIGEVVSAGADLSPIPEWIPWMAFIGGIVLKTGIGMIGLRAVSKVSYGAANQEPIYVNREDPFSSNN